MKRFLWRLTIFLVPASLFFGVPLYVLLKSGENFTSPDRFINSTNPYLIGYSYNEGNYSYLKWKSLVLGDRKDIIALGSSRVLQFRDSMFTGSFYNAGYTIMSMRDFIPFLESIPKEKYPDFLLIAVDQWMFNKSWDDFSSPPPPKHFWAKQRRIYPDAWMLNQVWKDLYHQKYGLNFRNTVVRRIGLNANLYRRGFRNDGSMDYGTPADKLLKDTTGSCDESFRRIKLGVNRFQYAEDVTPQAVHATEKLLRFCNRNGIMVVAILPPFADKVYDRMNDTKKYGYMNKIYPAIHPIFKKYDAELYDFSRASLCGSNDTEILDGFHIGELGSLRMIVKMLESGSALNNVADLQKLRQDLAKPRNQLSVYP